MEAIYGVTLISGVTVDDKAQVARFFFSNHRDLLRPLVTSLFFPKKNMILKKFVVFIERNVFITECSGSLYIQKIGLVFF